MADKGLTFVNQKVLPYNLADDTLIFKITARKGHRQLYRANISGIVYGTCGSPSGTIQELGTFSTNEFGIAGFTFDTNGIDNKSINTAKFWASGVIDGVNLGSAIARANFIYVELHDIIIINAGNCQTFPYGRDGFNPLIVYDSNLYEYQPPNGVAGYYSRNATTVMIAADETTRSI